MIGLMADVFILEQLEEVSNGRGGWTLKRDPKGNIFGCLLPSTISKNIEPSNQEQIAYDLVALIWKSDSTLVDLDTLISVDNKTYKIVQITDFKTSDKVILYLRGDDGNGLKIYS